MLGKDAYPDPFAKAAAPLHSLAPNHPLADGNKTLAWLANQSTNDVEIVPYPSTSAPERVLGEEFAEHRVPGIGAVQRRSIS